MGSVVAGHIALTLAPAACAVLSLRASRHCASGAVASWLLLAAAAAAVAVAQTIWAVQQLVLNQPIPFPSVSYFLFLLFHPLFSAALLLSLRGGDGDPAPRQELAQDALLACGAIALVLLRWVYEPMRASRPWLSSSELFWILSGQFVAQLSLVSALVLVIWRRTVLPPRIAALLALTALVNAIANVMTVEGLDPNAGSPGDAFDFVWLAGWTVFATAAWAGARQVPSEWTGRAAEQAGAILRRSLSPLVTLALTFTALDAIRDGSASRATITALALVGMLLALRLAVTLGAAEREQRNQQELERTRVLVQLSRTLAAAPDLDDALAHVSRAAQQLLRGRSVWIERRGASGVRLTAVQPNATEIEVPFNQSCSRWLGERRTAQWLTGPETPVLGPDGEPVPPRSWLGTATVRFGEHVSGCLAVKRRERGFDAAELELLGALADQAAVVMENARLLEDAREAERSRTRSERLAGLGQLAAGVAHEINNPLAAIHSASTLLGSDATGEEQSQAVSIIRTEAARAARIVRGMLDFVRPPAVESAAVPLREVIGSVLQARVQEQARQGVTTRVEVAGDALVRADRALLEQVFLNLIVNAEHALERSAQRLITITGAQEGPDVVVRVRDTGSGIATENLGRIFDPFFTTKAVGRGTGLGLSVSYGIVREMGGTINVQSDHGTGTTFTLRLPAAGPEGPSPAAEKAAQPAAESPARRLSILVVDDEASIRLVVSRFLTRRGHDVVAAEHGASALDAVKLREFDVIVTDLKMPVMDGERLFEELKRLPGRIQERVIFVSGDTVADATRRFLAGTGRPFISKPFDLGELVAKVEAIAHG